MLPTIAPGATVAKAAPGSAAPAAGSGGFTPSAAPPPITDPAGTDGVSIIGGFVVSTERDPRLTGTRKWITFDNQILNVAVIGAAVSVWTRLAGGAKWTLEPNPRGGLGAQVGADLVREGLLEAQLATPWNQCVRRQTMKAFRGFALHEVTVRRRRDDLIVVADIADRPQWTIWRWDRPDPRASWIGVEQQTQLAVGSAAPYIPRERLFYSVENTLTPSPEGIGYLRLAAESVRVLELYQQWEGIGFQNDLRGMPVSRAPLALLAQQAKTNGAKDPAAIQAYVQSQTRFLTDFLFGHSKTAEQGVMLDSATYVSKDLAQSPSSIYQWAFDLVKGASSGMPEVGQAIGRIVRDIARIMCAEWLMLGGEDSGGAYSMHEDKTAMFGLTVNSVLDDIAADATRDIAWRLVALNGLDPETCTPKLVPEPIATGAVKDACAALASLQMAGLQPGDPAINILRGRLNLPPAPEVIDVGAMLPRGAEGDPNADPNAAPEEPDQPGDGAPASEPAPAEPPGPSES